MPGNPQKYRVKNIKHPPAQTGGTDLEKKKPGSNALTPSGVMLLPANASSNVPSKERENPAKGDRVKAYMCSVKQTREVISKN